MRVIFRDFEDSWEVMQTHKYVIESIALEWDDSLIPYTNNPIFESNYIFTHIGFNWNGQESDTYIGLQYT